MPESNSGAFTPYIVQIKLHRSTRPAEGGERRFPRHFVRGPIEAIAVAVPSRSSPKFPRHFVRGPIEASSRHRESPIPA